MNAILNLIKSLFGAAKSGDIDAVEVGTSAAIALFDLWIDSSDFPDEGKAALKEQRDVVAAVVPIVIGYQQGVKPTKQKIKRLQSERVKADMAMGRLIGSIPTRG